MLEQPPENPQVFDGHHPQSPELDADAQRRLAGLQSPPPLPSEYALADTDAQAEQPGVQPGINGAQAEDVYNPEADEVKPRKPFSKLLFVTAAVGSVLGLVLVVVFGFQRTATKKPATVQTQASPPPQIVQDDSAELRSQLALQDQRRQLAEGQPPTNPDAMSGRDKKRLERDQQRQQRQTGRTARRNRTTSDESVERPIRTRTVIREAPNSVLSERISRTPRPRQDAAPATPPVDPYKRWASLTGLGDTASDAETVAAQPDKGNTNGNANGNANGNPPALSAGTMRQAMGANNSTNNPFSTVLLGASPMTADTSLIPMAETFTAAAPITRLTSAESNLSPGAKSIVAAGTLIAANAPQTGGKPNQSLGDSASTQVEDEPLMESSSESDWGDEGNEPNEAVDPTVPMTVELGTLVPATVVVPMALDLNQQGRSESNNASAGRFVIQLQQDLVTRSKEVALKKGTNLIVQGTVSKNNQLVQASAIAIVYRDADGIERQQVLPPGALLVQGAGGNPLIAQKLNDVGPELFKEDLLVGGLAAAGKAGEILNQPENDISNVFNSTTGESSSSGIFTSRSRKPNILGGALAGFGSVLSSRIERRSE